ncbi:MAG: hypothetical protein N2749_03825 [Clostridia bacterium]|nr:hypothetical protein [Clostridia bacterium]
MEKSNDIMDMVLTAIGEIDITAPDLELSPGISELIEASMLYSNLAQKMINFINHK